MVDERRYNGLTIGRRRVARLMRDAREWAQGSAEAAVQAHHRQPSRLADRPNLLDQDFAAAMPNQKWGADISYVWTREDWLYLAVVIDLFARRVIGWATSDRLHKELALSALRRAVAVRIPAVGLSHHADRGRQDCSLDYQAELRKNGRVISMSGKANGFDNAMVETFFKTLKANASGAPSSGPGLKRAPKSDAISTLSTIPSGEIRRSTSSARFSSRGRPRKPQNALHKCGESPSPPSLESQ